MIKTTNALVIGDVFALETEFLVTEILHHGDILIWSPCRHLLSPVKFLPVNKIILGDLDGSVVLRASRWQQQKRED